MIRLVRATLVAVGAIVSELIPAREVKAAEECTLDWSDWLNAREDDCSEALEPRIQTSPAGVSDSPTPAPAGRSIPDRNDRIARAASLIRTETSAHPIAALAAARRVVELLDTQ